MQDPEQHNVTRSIEILVSKDEIPRSQINSELTNGSR